MSSFGHVVKIGIAGSLIAVFLDEAYLQWTFPDRVQAAQARASEMGEEILYCHPHFGCEISGDRERKMQVFRDLTAPVATNLIDFACYLLPEGTCSEKLDLEQPK